MNGFRIFLLTLIASSCTVHVPFQSEESKAEYHLRQAYYHNPSLADSTEKTIYIPRKSAEWSIKFPDLARPLLLNPISLVDTTTGVSATLSASSDSVVYLTADCPPQEVIYKESPTLTVPEPYIPEWMLFIMFSGYVVAFILYLSLKK